MTSPDQRERFLRTLKAELAGRPLARRRVLREIAAHFDDLVAELRATGLPERAATQEALRRLGDPEAIATAFSGLHPSRTRCSRLRSLRSPAWIAVAAMSLVTAWAAELPPASGATSTRPSSALASHRPARAAVAGHARRAKRHSPQKPHFDRRQR